MYSPSITQTALAALYFCMAGSATAQGIYTCVDGKGRKITADRPILECNDRVQQEMTKSGNVKRVLVPVPTPQEKAEQDEKDKRVAEERAREADEKRRDRALLLRYPHLQAHNKERAQALDQIDEVIKAAFKRITELGDQRKAVQADLEFYKGDPTKAPPTLKRRIEENESGVAAQKRFIAEQEMEKKRVTQRFDEELAKLRQLWAMAGGAPQPATAKK
jgi:DNA repair exonuclease SbcCD ATPase subunit